MANRDPRHNGKFAESFAFAYAISVLDAGLHSLTLSALTGPFGLIAGEQEPAPAGQTRPVSNAVKSLAQLAGKNWKQCLSSRPSDVLAIAIEDKAMWLVNITQHQQEIVIPSGKTLKIQPYDVQSIEL